MQTRSRGNFGSTKVPAAKVRSGMLAEREKRGERERKEREKETYKENIYGARQGLIMLALEIRELFGQVATGMLRRRYRSERTVLAEKYPFAVVAACRFDFVILYLGE